MPLRKRSAEKAARRTCSARGTECGPTPSADEANVAKPGQGWGNTPAVEWICIFAACFPSSPAQSSQCRRGLLLGKLKAASNGDHGSLDDGGHDKCCVPTDEKATMAHRKTEDVNMLCPHQRNGDPGSLED